MFATTSRSFLTLAFWLALSFPAHAADPEGMFAVKGAGVTPCEKYASDYRSGRESVVLHATWLNGYISALNQVLPQTYDIVSWQDINFLMSYVAEVCERDPSLNFYAAAGQMLTNFRPEAIRARELPVTIEQPDAAPVALYPTVVKRIQDRLSALGFYDGESDGEFGESTATALTAFQRSRELDATGSPDTNTVFRLMYFSQVEEAGRVKE